MATQTNANTYKQFQSCFTNNCKHKANSAHTHKQKGPRTHMEKPPREWSTATVITVTDVPKLRPRRSAFVASDDAMRVKGSFFPLTLFWPPTTTNGKG